MVDAPTAAQHAGAIAPVEVATDAADAVDRRIQAVVVKVPVVVAEDAVDYSAAFAHDLPAAGVVVAG